MSASRRLPVVLLVLGLAACSSGPRGTATVELPAARDAAPSPAPEPVAAADAAPEPTQAPPPAERLPFETTRAGLAIAVPAGWKTRRRDLALIYEGPMRVPSVVLFEPAARTLDEAVTGLPAELRAPLGAVRITKQPEATTVAGYEAFVVEGTGRAEGFPMRWRATVIDAGHLTIMLGLTPSFFWGANRSRIVAFERGVRRAPATTATLGSAPAVGTAPVATTDPRTREPSDR